MVSIDQQLKTIKSGVAQLTPESSMIDKLKSGKTLRIKLGVDPTAPDLHLGHAVPLRKLRQFQELGHTVVLIIGDFTALIGDPSGRNTTRPPLTPEQIDENARTYIDQAFRILDPEKTELRRNSEWLSPLGFAEILALASRFTVARILERDDFAKRYSEQKSISLHEFLYPVAQAYDSVAIQSDVEIGGTDQLFNLLAGRELMEKEGMEPQVVLTLPLLEGTDGVLKMSKSYGNYIGLTDAPSDMFGKVMSIPDALMPTYYRLATAVPVEEIETLEAALTAGEAHPNKVKRRLAAEIVTMYYDAEAALAAEKDFDHIFKNHDIPEDIPEYSASLTGDVYLPGLIVDAGLASSNGEARRLIDGGGVKINSESVASRCYEVPAEALSGSVLQVGKRKFVRLV